MTVCARADLYQAAAGVARIGAHRPSCYTSAENLSEIFKLTFYFIFFHEYFNSTSLTAFITPSACKGPGESQEKSHICHIHTNFWFND